MLYVPQQLNSILALCIMLYATTTRAFHLVSRRTPCPRTFFSSIPRRRPSILSYSRLYSSVANDFLKENDDVVITYMTDVEGDKAYLDRYVELSKVLEFISCDDGPYRHQITFSQDNSMLIFGGDLWDKGGFDLYVARQLLSLKERFPDRVWFVCGNRDINKMRILQEIGISGDVPEHPGIMWIHGTGKIGDPQLGLLSLNDPVERLQWILGKTMGSPDAFALRKQELEWENYGKEVTDMDVVESYRQSCHPSGEMGQFLKHSHLAFKIGPIMVVHGSLPMTEDVMQHASSSGVSVWDDLTFCMPWIEKNTTASDHGVTTVDEWTDALNQFCHDKVQQWGHNIRRVEESGKEDTIWAHRGGYDYGPSYAQLLQYGMGMTPDRKKNPTVVYNSFTPEGMPQSFDPNSENTDFADCTKEFFDRANVQLILAGHKPQGDAPSPIRVDSSCWVLCCDTSYSGETLWIDSDKKRTNMGRGNALSFRGDHCVSEVLVYLSQDKIQSVKYHGILSDGMEYETANLLAHSNNSTIGQVAPQHLVPSELESPHQGRWWTKSIFSDGSYLFHAGQGFNVWNYFSKHRQQTKREDDRIPAHGESEKEAR